MTQCYKSGDTLEDFQKWSGKQLIRQLEIEIQIMKNRKESGDLLTANEILITISRERYYQLCQLALDRLYGLLNQ